MENFEAMKNEIKEEIKEVEGGDIEDKELRKRREWIMQYRQEYNGKIPEGLDKFYENDKKDAAGGGDDEEGDDAPTTGKKGKGDKKGKEGGKKKKGKKGKGGGGGDDAAEAKIKIGPTEVVGKFNEFYSEYNNDWSTRDESDNKE